ncbi:hypothetical protein [Nocardia brasiliensis]|uniref:hypothetical protein n=1 Tax=Nocardia brasiliensis TaxID=37326 RepID=UPI002458930F|nr:hypothetical protein [Nocardia brasiliensis]
MSIHPDAYEQFLSGMLSAPTDSVEHHLAEAVSAILNDDDLQVLLVRMFLEDPPGTREHTLAGQLLARLFPPRAQS